MSGGDLKASSAERGQGLSEALLPTEDVEDDDWKSQLQCLLVDILAFSVFVYIFPYWVNLPNIPYYCGCAGFLLAGALWRAIGHRMRGVKEATDADKLPYTTGFFTDAEGRQLYLVASVHISPRSPEDAEAVIAGVRPDVVMIELDEERLDIMRPKKPEAPKTEDLQQLKLSGAGVQEAFGESAASIYGQRATWNAERCGDVIRGNLVFDEANPHGLLRPGDAARGNILLVHRGPPGLVSVEATFPVKAFRAAAAGVKAIVVIDSNEQLPSQRLGAMGGQLAVEMKVAWQTGSLGFPPIPCIMVSKAEGERLVALCAAAAAQSSSLQLEFEVMDDLIPRRTLRRNLCQTCLLFGSGVGILYGIVRCFNVEVGAEFMAAEVAATEQGVPCVCIDVDMNRLWSRMLQVVIPTPRNVGRVVWSWMALPRVGLRVLFPRSDSVDTLGSMVLHARSFPLRNWIAFTLAGSGASCVSTHILQFISGGVTYAAVDANVVRSKDTADFQVLLLNLTLLYLMPCLYEAVLASRDEAMYQGIRARARSSEARCMVAVTGAAHTNGILQRCRDRGL